jgi:hypothetical protein
LREFAEEIRWTGSSDTAFTMLNRHKTPATAIHAAACYTYQRGLKVGGRGTTSTFGSKTIGEAVYGSKDIGLRGRRVSDAVATVAGLGKLAGGSNDSWSRGCLWCLCIFEAIDTMDSAVSPSRRRLNNAKASPSVTDTRLCNNACCSLHCCCSASFLRFCAMMGVASASAT